LLETTLITVSAGAIAGVTLPFLPLPAADAWPWLAASVALHIVYFLMVAGAYRFGDLSHTYPLMRGGAPLLVTLATPIVLSEVVSPQVNAGVLLVSIGVACPALVTLLRPKTGAATAFAGLNAIVIATYTVVDGQGARLSAQAVSYSQWLFFLTAFGVAAVSLLRHQHGVFAYGRKRLWHGLAGGAFTVGAYGIVVWAMTQAPVAAVAALRETSVVFAAVIGATLLKESMGAMRITGAIVVA
ncbi:MAG: EamA family transporter, partial [Betaproteobacteria bacterium]|nr:EamA family transporter [Betaproteobacteria bacterium]